MPKTSLEAALAELLRTLYDEPGLRRFLHHGPDGAALSSEMPSAPTQPAELAHQAVLCLVRRGLVNQELFDRLRAERPKRSAEIEVVYQRWSGHLQPSLVDWSARAARPKMMYALALLLLIGCWVLFQREVEPRTPRVAEPAPVTTVIAPQAPLTVFPTVPGSTPAPSPTELSAAEPKASVRATGTIRAPSTVTLKADGEGSTAVGGKLKASADKVTIDASNGATAGREGAHITSTDASVTATGGATGFQGDVVFEAKK